MKPFILTKRDEYKSSYDISICLLLLLIPCFVYFVYVGIDGKLLMSILLVMVCPLYSVFRFITLKDKGNYNTLVINNEGILICQGGINKMIKWSNIHNVSFHLGEWRLDGVVMDISIKGNKRVRFSFFNYRPGVSIKKIKKSIRYFSKNPEIVKQQVHDVKSWKRGS